VEDERQELALEAARDAAPVAAHGLEADDLELVADEPAYRFLLPIAPPRTSGMKKRA
jgi:hypothetical protein